MAKILSYDIGTTGVKTCLYTVADEIKLIGAASEGWRRRGGKPSARALKRSSKRQVRILRQ